MADQQPPNNVQTIEITNFGGRLTRIFDGDPNSGYAKFTTSFGYDPFSKPNNLTWLYQPTDLASVSPGGIIAATLYSPATTQRFVYAIDQNASPTNLYLIDPTNSATADTPLYDTASVISKLSTSPSVMSYGADIEAFNGLLYFTTSSSLYHTTFTGTSLTPIGSSSIVSSIYHPLIQFIGKLFMGNGNNLMEVDQTNTVVNYAVLTPPLPAGTYIQALDVTPDGNYMIIAASYLYPTDISNPASKSDRGNPYAMGSALYFWNGSDQSYTSQVILPSFPATAIKTFLSSQYTFNTDGLGVGLYEGNQKLLTLPANVSPMNHGVDANGTFLTWAAPEITGTINVSTGGGQNSFTSLYYYGYLDGENEPGLWRMMRQAPSSPNGVAWKTPLNMMVNNYSFSQTFVAGWGKHYISVIEYDTNLQQENYHFYRFVLPPAANTPPQLGVYETQNQIFSKRATIKAIRVYTEPTASGNGFQVDLIGSGGNVITNGTFNYTYASGTDITLLQGSLERIDFTPTMKDVYSVGVRITNTGTTNMTIHKIEVDWAPSGK
jgi:hypothetical protein